MISDHVIYVLYMVIAFLLPLVPAYFLYKSLPSKTVVKGPFKGLNLQLSGAFAGYFLLILIMQGLILLRPKPQPPPPPFEVYRVEGKLKDVPEAIVEDVVKGMFLRPADRETLGEGQFSLDILVKRNQITHEMILPNLVVLYKGYESKTVALNESSEYEIEREPGLIKIKKPITLQEISSQPYEGMQ